MVLKEVSEVKNPATPVFSCGIDCACSNGKKKECCKKYKKKGVHCKKCPKL